MRRVSHEMCPIQVNGKTLEFVVKFCYLGDMFGSGDGAEQAFRMRGREVNVHLVSVENLPEGTGAGHCRFSRSKQTAFLQDTKMRTAATQSDVWSAGVLVRGTRCLALSTPVITVIGQYQHI